MPQVAQAELVTARAPMAEDRHTVNFEGVEGADGTAGLPWRAAASGVAPTPSVIKELLALVLCLSHYAHLIGTSVRAGGMPQAPKGPLPGMATCQAGGQTCSRKAMRQGMIRVPSSTH